MNLFFYIFLFIFWTLFGSFASVLIYRIKSWESGIWTWRSHCKTCERDLTVLELIPILSWIFQWWKCKGCKEKISSIYPILEVSTGILFILVGVFLISPELIFSGNITEWWRMIFFCSIMFLTIIYVFYDILYLEIPESILLSANILSVMALIIQWLWIAIIPYLPVWNSDLITVSLCIWVLISLYIIMLWGLKEIYDCLILWVWISLLVGYMYLFDVSYNYNALLSGTLAAVWIFVSFFLQILVSSGKWMGWGDLRIAILMWLFAWSALAFSAWMLCYIIWSIIWVGFILYHRAQYGFKKSFEMQIPFGPFIASWYLCVLFFAPQIQELITWYL